MASPDAVLDSIDGALRDYATSADAMRWSPEPENVKEGLEPCDCGVTDFARLINTEALAAFHRSLNEAFSIMAGTMGRTLEAFTGMYHPLMAIYDRRHRNRCHVCNPAGNPLPFPGGAEYHRRRKARQRRRRG